MKRRAKPASAANKAARPAPYGHSICTCTATPGRLCAECIRLGNRGWPIGADSSSRRARLSPAALSRVAGDAATPDMFGDELREARRASARSGAAIDRRYEGLKDGVRRKAKGRPNAYERGIRAAVKRIKY